MQMIRTPSHSGFMNKSHMSSFKSDSGFRLSDLNGDCSESAKRDLLTIQHCINSMSHLFSKPNIDNYTEVSMLLFYQYLQYYGGRNLK